MIDRFLALVVLVFSLCAFGWASACPPSPTAAACIQQALDRLEPGEVLRLEAGEYGLEAPLHLRRPGIAIEGEGERTRLRRAVSVSEGAGVINLHGSRQALRHFHFDGGVTQPRRIPYIDPTGAPSVLGAPIFGNPMHPDLLTDSSLTVHRGAAGIRIEGITIEHSGGYAVFLDARYGDIRDVVIRDCTLRNNRPHLFGVAATGGQPADLRYGAWTGGIHYQNDGRDLPFARFGLKGLLVEDCRFERIAGHAVWGHGYGFHTLNEEIVVRRNRFSDIGLDGVQIGNARRVQVAGNEMVRIGYIAETDEEWPRPAWHPGARADMADNIPPVGIDTTGLVIDSIYRDNTITSVNGTAIDLDGFTAGEILRNEIRIPGRENAYGWALDRIAEFGPYRPGGEPPGNLTKGINVSNSSAAEPAQDIRIVENRLINLGGYAMLLLDCQRSLVARNEIRHYSTLSGPIVLANTLRQPRDRHVSSGNVVRENWVYFPWHAACVTEADNIGAGELPVAGPNYVFDNACNALWGELDEGRASQSVNGPPLPTTLPQP